MNREFFKGHKLQIVYLCLIENGPNIVSIDSNGHIFVWRYEKEFISTKQHFNPAVKLRLSLKSFKFIRLSEKRIFPEGKEKEISVGKGGAIDGKIAGAIKQYMIAKELDPSEIIKKALDITPNAKTNTTVRFINY
jgi:hypothetical protein